MGFFNWAAPLFQRFGDRWDPAEIARMADSLRPYVPPGGRILDVGGGTGALAEHLAEALGCRATVLDATPEMLAYAATRPGVQTIEGCADAMPFAEATFDAVIVSDAFHHFSDQDGAVREMRRVTRCGGGVLVLDFDPSGAMKLVVAAEKLLGEPGAFLTPAEMCRFMAERGVEGECAKTHGVSYRFLGSVT